MEAALAIVMAPIVMVVERATGTRVAMLLLVVAMATLVEKVGMEVFLVVVVLTVGVAVMGVGKEALRMLLLVVVIANVVKLIIVVVVKSAVVAKPLFVVSVYVREHIGAT